MRVVVAGCRTFTNFTKLNEFMNEFSTRHEITEVVSGCAKGADTLGECWANDHRIPIKKFPADWENNGKAAGMIRNGEMANYGDALVAFWDGKSRGTKNMIYQMKKLGKLVIIVEI